MATLSSECVDQLSVLGFEWASASKAVCKRESEISPTEGPSLQSFDLLPLEFREFRKTFPSFTSIAGMWLATGCRRIKKSSLTCSVKKVGAE